MKLGFFDSGMGGLYMMEACREQYPGHEYVYLGDTKNLPYGPKNVDEILRDITPCLLFLIENEQCDYVVIACNTAGAQSLSLFLDRYPQYISTIINIVDITKQYFEIAFPELEYAFVLSTQRTATSKVYERIGKKVYQIPMPGLVDLIEENNYPAALILVNDALSYYESIPLVLLGCTHYSYLKEILEEKYPDSIILSQDEILIAHFSHIIKKNIDENKSKTKYYVTGSADDYTARHSYTFHQINFKNNS